MGASQSFDVTISHENSNNNNAFQFTSNDRVRFVSTRQSDLTRHGKNVIPCLNPDGSSILSSKTITVNDTAQPDNGFPIIISSFAEAGKAVGSAQLPYAYMMSTTQNIQLCYRDSAGNEFAVPLSFSTQPSVAAFALTPRQPMAMTLLTPYPQLGQRLLMNFTATPYMTHSSTSSISSSTSNIESSPFVSAPVFLTPFAPLPNPFVPAPLYNGSFDVAGMLRYSSSSSSFTNMYR